jgi:hypothetical protein
VEASVGYASGEGVPERRLCGDLPGIGCVDGPITNGGTDMSQQPPSPVKDKNYDLITMLRRCLKASGRPVAHAPDGPPGPVSGQPAP